MKPPAQRIYDALQIGLLEMPSLFSQDMGPILPAEMFDSFPVHPSSLDSIDTKTGGVFGLTAIGGEPGTGKSILGFAIALRAAARMDGTRVVYIPAESDEIEIDNRVSLAATHEPGLADAQDYIHFLHPGRGVSAKSLFADVTGCLTPEDERLLVVLDSVNSIAKLSGRSYLHTIDELTLWAMIACKWSCGQVCFVVLSELNKRGGMKGEQLSYWAHLDVRIKKVKDHPGVVTLEILKSRRGGEGALGKYVIEWDRQLLSHPREQGHLRSVGGGKPW